LAGIAYRKVVSVSATGDGISLETERTTLPEAIKNGTLEWSQTIDFSPAAGRQMTATVGDVKIGEFSQAISTPISYNGEIEGYMVSITMTPSDGRIDINAVVKLEVLGEERFGIEATGYIEGFRTEGHAVVGEGLMLEFETGQRQVRGDLHIKAAAFNTGLNDELLDIPFGIDVPIQVGPVPLILKIKANINVRLILSLMDSSAEAEVSFQFSSDQGISVEGSELNATGALSSGTLSDFAGGSVDGAAAGMSACLEVPRFELSMAGEFASVGITQNNCASTTFTFDPACNEVNGDITGIALASLGFFGVTLASGQVELYHEEDGIDAGDCD
jgi:hypothetical protein